jgi:hypothetical protein
MNKRCFIPETGFDVFDEFKTVPRIDPRLFTRANFIAFFLPYNCFEHFKVTNLGESQAFAISSQSTTAGSMPEIKIKKARPRSRTGFCNV